MTGTAKVVFLSSAPAAAARRGRWQGLRDLVGGALLLAMWLALWTVTWAAVAGPLSPAHGERSAPAAVARA